MQRNPDLLRDLRTCRSALHTEWGRRRPLQELWAAIGDPAHFAEAVTVASLLPPGHALASLRRRTRARGVPILPPTAPDEAVWTFLEATWTSRQPPAAPPSIPLLRDWLFERYALMWSTAPHVPLLRALDRAIAAGAWDVALDPLLAELDSPAARITVFADWRNPRAPWRPGSRLHPGPSPLGPHDHSDLAGYTEDEMRYLPHKVVLLHVFHDSLDSAVDELRRRWPALIAPDLSPPPGSHGRGDVTEWDKLVTLYRLWRRYENDRRQSGRPAVKKGFARAATNKTLPLWQAVERQCRNDPRTYPGRIAWLAGLSASYVEDRLRMARGLFAPDQAVPALEHYLRSFVKSPSPANS